MDIPYFNGKEIWITSHAIKRARERDIAYPDQVYDYLFCGRATRFAKNGIKFTKLSKSGSIICIGEDKGYAIIITKTALILRLKSKVFHRAVFGIEKLSH